MPRYGRMLRVGLCALIACLLYLPGLGRPALWEPDEGRYAEIAREMVQSGDYITPRDDWVRYFEKPPLIYWSSALAIKVLGTNEFAVRLPAALSSIGQVTITYALAEEMFGAAVGLLAASSLALSPLFFGFGRVLTLDPALACFTEAALASFYIAARAAPSLDNARSRNWLLVAAAMMALGTLTKGPVALVLSGGIALIYLIAERRGRELIHIPWLGCGLIYLAIVAPWFVVVARRNPDFLGFFFVHEHLQRYVSSTEHPWGIYFFIPVTLAGMWPWIYFVPRAIARLRDPESTEPASERRPALIFLLIWFAFVFVFFSIPHSKLGSYILPGLPPLAILAGYGLWSIVREEAAHARRELGALACVNAGIAAIAIPVLVLVSWHYRMIALG
ncbi:MAG TPA: glycosyltransferase family 39 protein, partial [Candidatus Binataceae bacterium]|nr:glycosyltransferase family 39 protein [Candidatus Binataceae bacterium]